MLVSVNEIETTVYKAMSGKGLADGVCVGAAKSASYLETMGIKVLADVVRFLSIPPHSIKPIDYDKANNALDLQNISCIYWAQTLALLAMEHLTHRPNITLNHSRDVLFAIRYLRKKHAIMLAYDEPTNQQHHCVFMSPDVIYPRALCRMPIKQTKAIKASAYLSTYSDEDYQRCVDGAEHILTNTQLAQTHQQLLINGIDVDDTSFKQLQQYAQNILVENTDASLQGAGASVNSIDPEDVPIRTP